LSDESLSLAVSIGLFAGLMLLLDLGYRVGDRQRRQHPETSHEGVGVIEAAVFALLGLLLAFSLSDAMTRLDQRRQLIVTEANSISTAYQRIDLLPPADQPAMRSLFRVYLDARLAAYQKFPDDRAAEAGMDQAEKIEDQIWEKAVAGARASSDREAELLLLPAISDMDSVTTERKFALHTHIPPFVFALLISVALLSALLAGYAMAKRGTRSWLHLVIYPVVVAVTIFALLELEYPRSGHHVLEPVDKAMYDLRDSIK
jgi:hypothetical protein